MRALAISHELDSGPSMVGDALRRCAVDVVDVLASSEMPMSVEGFDLLVVMGATPSVNDEDIRPWFDRELALLRDAEANDVPILGICFGAQALAVATGGSVCRAARPEIGWFTVTSTDSELVEDGPWFEWHVDAITPPVESTVIATTPTCVQAFTVGRHLGVQFHPEVTDDDIAIWASNGADQLLEVNVDPSTFTAQGGEAAGLRCNRLVERFLNRAFAADALGVAPTGGDAHVDSTIKRPKADHIAPNRRTFPSESLALR